MKATGIVRRLDDLGRVVIPKEIRRSMKIKEGDPLEIYTDKGTVVFRKYLPPIDTEIIDNLIEAFDLRLTDYEDNENEYAKIKECVAQLQYIKCVAQEIN